METKERILAGAEELFNKHGIKRITMDEIAQHLSVSKKTIYQFFGEKDDLVDACCKIVMDKRECEFEKIQYQAKDAVEEMINAMKHMSAMFSKMNPNLFYDLQKFYPKTWTAFREFKEQNMMGIIEKNLKAGIKQQLYRADIPVKTLSILRMYEVEFGMNPDVFPPDKFNHVQVQVALLNHFLYGICTLKGHKLVNKYLQVKEEE